MEYGMHALRYKRYLCGKRFDAVDLGRWAAYFGQHIYTYINIYTYIHTYIYFRLPYIIWPPSTDSPELPSFYACQHISPQKELNDFGQNLILLVY
jgi:hypothetical protein